MDLDHDLSKLESDGKISAADVDAVRSFGAFLEDVADVDRSTPEGRRVVGESYLRHFPEVDASR